MNEMSNHALRRVCPRLGVYCVMPCSGALIGVAARATLTIGLEISSRLPVFPLWGVISVVLLHTIYMLKQTCLYGDISLSEPVISPFFLAVILPRVPSDSFLLPGAPRCRLALTQ